MCSSDLVSPDGRVLVADEVREVTSTVFGPDKQQRDVTWYGQAECRDISDDGKRLLFTERATSGGKPGVFLGFADGAPPTYLGPGEAMALSRDQKWVLAVQREHSGEPEAEHLILIPTGEGQTRVLPRDGLMRNRWGASWFPDNKHYLFIGKSFRKSRDEYALFVGSLDADKPRQMTDWEGGFPRFPSISPDGREVACDRGDEITVYPVSRGAPRKLPGIRPAVVLRWSADARKFAVGEPRAPKGIGEWFGLLDVQSGKKEEILSPSAQGVDPAGFIGGDDKLTPDGRAMFDCSGRVLNALYLVEGVR